MPIDNHTCSPREAELGLQLPGNRLDKAADLLPAAAMPRYLFVALGLLGLVSLPAAETVVAEITADQQLLLAPRGR